MKKTASVVRCNPWAAHFVASVNLPKGEVEQFVNEWDNESVSVVFWTGFLEGEYETMGVTDTLDVGVCVDVTATPEILGWLKNRLRVCENFKLDPGRFGDNKFRPLAYQPDR